MHETFQEELKEKSLQSKVADHYTRSLDYYNQRNYDAAIYELHEALAIDPTNHLLLARLGSVYYTYGFLDHAAFYWKRAIDINPSYPL